jgi:hypothetical protein
MVHIRLNWRTSMGTTITVTKMATGEAGGNRVHLLALMMKTGVTATGTDEILLIILNLRCRPVREAREYAETPYKATTQDT